MKPFQLTIVVLALLFCHGRLTTSCAQDAGGHQRDSVWQHGKFRWKVGPSFLTVDRQRLPKSEEHPWIAVKDPSIVRHNDQWHLFCTLRKQKKGDGRIRIGYLAFPKFSDAKNADWSLLDLTLDYHGAPQIFFYRPQQIWYMIYQAADPTRNLKYGPCYSTNPEISDPKGWTKPEPLYVVPDGKKAGLDFWVICDEQKAHLFFTSLNGKMWRAETKLADFPNKNWTEPTVVLKADIFEASHTYTLRGRNQYFTIVEAQGDRRRYFKGYIADRLEGPWNPLAGDRGKALVSQQNVINQSESWAGSYSHGEFLRDGIDERLEIDPSNLRLLFQGASDKEYRANEYGNIPWKLGILEAQSRK